MQMIFLFFLGGKGGVMGKLETRVKGLSDTVCLFVEQGQYIPVFWIRIALIDRIKQLFSI